MQQRGQEEMVVVAEDAPGCCLGMDSWMVEMGASETWTFEMGASETWTFETGALDGRWRRSIRDPHVVNHQ